MKYMDEYPYMCDLRRSPTIIRHNYCCEHRFFIPFTLYETDKVCGTELNFYMLLWSNPLSTGVTDGRLIDQTKIAIVKY